MTRTVSATISTAAVQETTKPIYLVRMGWATELRRATWDADISWNAETWTASGVKITNLTASSGQMELPNGDGDPWLALVQAEIPRDLAINIYEHHTNYTVSPAVSDAVLIFSGFMDAVSIGDDIRVSLVEGTTKKVFPLGEIDRPIYTYLLSSGTVIRYGDDMVTVN